MHPTNTPTWLVLLALAGAGCGRAPGDAAPASSATAKKDVVAIVNGASITQADVRLRGRNDGHKSARAKAAPDAPNLGNVLETVIGEELAAQRATALGLDADPKYQEGLAKLEAQLAAYRRRALADLFWERSVDKSVVVTDAEAQQFFDVNQGQIRAELHLLQILRRGEPAMDEVRQKLDTGTSFEEVAASLFPNRHAGETPWDMGWLRWYNLPEQWRPVVHELKPGDVSPVIRGPNERCWILKLVERREAKDVNFEAAKPAILADLKRTRLEAARENARRDLREKARVQRVAPPTPEPRPPVED